MAFKSGEFKILLFHNITFGINRIDILIEKIQLQRDNIQKRSNLGIRCNYR